MLKDKIKELVARIDLGFILFVAVIAYLLLLIKNDITRSDELVRGHGSAADQIRRQEIMKRSLIRELKLLDQNEHIERLAREQLGMIKQGESAYKVVKINRKGGK